MSTQHPISHQDGSRANSLTTYNIQRPEVSVLLLLNYLLMFDLFQVIFFHPYKCNLHAYSLRLLSNYVISSIIIPIGFYQRFSQSRKIEQILDNVSCKVTEDISSIYATPTITPILIFLRSSSLYAFFVCCCSYL